jgi:hypothetical protein
MVALGRLFLCREFIIGLGRNILMIEQRQHSWCNTDSIHPDLSATKRLVYDRCQFTCTQPQIEPESREYGAYSFELNDLSIRFRVAKITPTKIGQFVTLWKRIGKGPIQPYDVLDSVDFFIVSVRNNQHFGQFVFSKSVLHQQGVLSKEGKGGKRAIRVYPPWDKAANSQAQKTQKWQLEYFLEIPEHQSIDCVRSQMLYS